ncbi:MAG: phosphatidate cytidylyltransferase [Acidobacteriota bacterium]|jgi:phosphatidate cytidylyltransferase|nr:phosphatidate cytidylyltransferase [Acidobacteriota bacterium]
MQRILTALIALPVIIASIWFDRLALVFVLLAAAAMMAGLYEFWILSARRDLKAMRELGTVFAVAFLVLFYYRALSAAPALVVMTLVAFVVVALAAAMMRGAPFERMIGSAGATVLGVLYVVFLGGHVIALRTTFEPALARDLLFFFLLVLMGSDTAAYYTGRALGRHKLAPRVSPGKTWEGAVGGMLASLAAAALAHYWFFPELTLRAALPLAALMNVCGVLGDLTESALKRSAGAKDAAKILPGHGGLLDRLDSLLFNAPLLYYFAVNYFPAHFQKLIP